MSDKKIDLRIQKTYDALIRAFQELLKEKTFEEITVKELCEKAKTRTATFYSHFDDKYDFFFFMIKKIRSSFYEQIENSYDKNSNSNYYIDLIRCGLDYLEENKEMMNSIKSSNFSLSMIRIMQDDMKEILNSHLKNDSVIYGKLNYPDIMIEFLLGGFNQVSEAWFMNQKQFDKEKTLNDMTLLIENLIKN